MLNVFKILANSADAIFRVNVSGGFKKPLYRSGGGR
jgi:hypothetical protein